MWVALRRPCAWKTLGSFEELKEKDAHISHLWPAQVGTVGARGAGCASLSELLRAVLRWLCHWIAMAETLGSSRRNDRESFSGSIR